mgnify:CR=1 FL=1
MGLKRLGKGTFEGITGIVTKPVKGARSGGVSGFFKGLGKGLIGLPVKPIVGVMGTWCSSGLLFVRAQSARILMHP